ncbi:MAG TPA: hypothetical protein VFE91_02145 [Nitrososphaerales archaeon]|nr:hypothetical protein [Nitrososphaerales archaeon]
MLADKTVRYEGKNTNLNLLGDNTTQYLRDDGFKVQSSRPGLGGTLLQAQKGGFLRDIVTAERALNILIQGEPNNFTVRVGIGKWFQNIGVAAVETLLISEIFLPIDVAEMAWNVEVEKKVLKRIDELVGMGRTMAMGQVQRSPTIKGRIERVTGAGHFVVYPNESIGPSMKTGDQVMVLTDMKQYLDIGLEVVREHMSSPNPSDFALVVKGGNRLLQQCAVYCNGERLAAIDKNGASKTELLLPVGGTLRFHIPDMMRPTRDSIVEVRDGETSIQERFGAIPGAELVEQAEVSVAS